MHDGLTLAQALDEALRDCDAAIAQLMRDGVEAAGARRAYRVALAKRQLELREEEKLPVSMVHDVSRGDGECARLRFELDVAEASYAATRERVLLRKREADVLREQMDREWPRRSDG